MRQVDENNLQPLLESAIGEPPEGDPERLVALAGSQRRWPAGTRVAALAAVAVAATVAVIVVATLNRPSDGVVSVAAAPEPAPALVCTFALAGSESQVSDRSLEVRADGTPDEDQLRFGPFALTLSVEQDRTGADDHPTVRIAIRAIESDARVSEALAEEFVSTAMLPSVESNVGPVEVSSGSVPPISWVCEIRPGA